MEKLFIACYLGFALLLVAVYVTCTIVEKRNHAKLQAEFDKFIQESFKTDEEYREFELEAIGKLLHTEQYSHVLNTLPVYTGDKRVDDKLCEEYNEYLNTVFVGDLFMVGEWLHRENVNRYLR